jgi:hypothetical protein
MAKRVSYLGGVISNISGMLLPQFSPKSILVGRRASGLGEATASNIEASGPSRFQESKKREAAAASSVSKRLAE